MFRPTRRPSSSKRLNIVCVWRMLRSHHLAYNYIWDVNCVWAGKVVDVRWYLVSRAVIPLGLCRCWRWAKGSGWRLAGLYASHLWGRLKKKLYVRGNSRCILIPIWGTQSDTYMWRWRSVEYTSFLSVLVFVTSCVLTYFAFYLLTYLFTYLLHGAGPFLRS